MLEANVGSTVVSDPLQDQTRQDDQGLPVYLDECAVPRDLRSAQALAAGGYQALGPVVAWLRLSPADPADPASSAVPQWRQDQHSSLVALHSTSEARRLKGFTWSWPQRGATRNNAQSRASGDRDQAGSARRAGGDRKVFKNHTPRQERGGNRRASLRVEPRRWLSDLFREGFIVIDTETTGLSARDEIIEIAAVGVDGAVLFESLVRPRSGRVPSASTRVHGLTYHDVAAAPTWPEVVEELFTVVAGHRLFAWNASFDERLSAQSSRSWGVPHPLPGFECAMRAYAACRGVGNGSLRLERAASVEGVLLEHQSHRSADDARLTLAVLRSLQRSAVDA